MATPRMHSACAIEPHLVTPKLYIAVLGLAACGKSDAREAPTTADPPSVIAATAADGADLLSLAIAGAACEVSGEAEVTITRDATGTVAKLGDTTILTMTDAEIHDADGVARMRATREALRVDLVSMEGIPVARIAGDATKVTIADGARRPVMVVAGNGAVISATSADGVATASITGTIDPMIAALLVTPGVPADVRALLACDRLLPTASTP